MPRPPRHLLASAMLSAAVLAVTVACTSTSSLFAFDLEIGPDTAVAGDTVTFTFSLVILPAQEVTITAVVNGSPVRTVEYTGAHDGRAAVAAGDASDLIAQFGAGQRLGQVEVRSLSEGRTVRTSQVAFVLQQ